MHFKCRYVWSSRPVRWNRVRETRIPAKAKTTAILVLSQIQKLEENNNTFLSYFIFRVKFDIDYCDGLKTFTPNYVFPKELSLRKHWNGYKMILSKNPLLGQLPFIHSCCQSSNIITASRNALSLKGTHGTLL